MLLLLALFAVLSTSNIVDIQLCRSGCLKAFSANFDVAQFVLIKFVWVGSIAVAASEGLSFLWGPLLVSEEMFVLVAAPLFKYFHLLAFKTVNLAAYFAFLDAGLRAQTIGTLINDSLRHHLEGVMFRALGIGGVGRATGQRLWKEIKTVITNCYIACLVFVNPNISSRLGFEAADITDCTPSLKIACVFDIININRGLSLRTHYRAAGDTIVLVACRAIVPRVVNLLAHCTIG